MRIETVESRGLAHRSYFVSDDGEAIVIDPRRDSEIYYQLAQRECSKIKYIFETHRNEDYVIGSLELQNQTEAEIAHSKETSFRYGEHSLGDGETFTIGNLRIRALYTPGHTNDSMCFVLYDSFHANTPVIVFTGDTLFVNDVGRTDLPGLDAWEKQSEKLFDSLHEKVLPLGDHVIVYPGHGSGSICGHNIGDRDSSTIGYERKTNLLLGMDRETFVGFMMNQGLLRPPYFKKTEEYNLIGPPLLRDAANPESLDVDEFQSKKSQTGTVIVDTRNPVSFAGSHIPGSINIWLDGLSFFPGWVLTYDQKILLVTERLSDVKTAKTYLYRLGFDSIIGYLCPGIVEWRNKGKPVEQIRTLSASMLKERLDRNGVILIDVREEQEWNEGHIKGSKQIYVGHLRQKTKDLPRDKSIALTCAWGGRGSLGASILKKNGFKDVYNVVGGMKAWKSLGYSLTM